MAEIVDFGERLTTRNLADSSKAWDAACASVEGKRPLATMANRLLSDIRRINGLALEGRSRALLLPGARAEDDEVTIGLMIHAHGVEMRPLLVLKLSFVPQIDVVPASLSPQALDSRLAVKGGQQWRYSHTTAIDRVVRRPLISFGQWYDGRLLSVSDTEFGWEATQYSRFPTPGRCVQMVSHLDARQLRDLDAVTARLDPANRNSG